MLWLAAIPFIIFFTFWDLVGSCFPDLCAYSDHRSFLAWCFLIAVGCFASGLISAVPIGIACFIGSLPDRTGRKDQEYPLVALRERDGVQGNFYFLGAGSIRDAQYYFWYRRNPGGDVSGGKTYRGPGVRIYEGSETPKMVTFKTEYVNPGIESWLWLVGLDMRDETDWCPDFYIPTGSIKEGYVL